ncbi:MAG: nicotinate phosphoribosyltransferase, partial [Burkholderiales bacterium]|nr:nicotinate phosphoribosyltransferase [Burkholderiales bacterium]
MDIAPRDPGASALLTDLYQLTMLKAYWERGMSEPAVFEFFVRKLPACRNFLLAAGLEGVLEFLEGLRFEPEELEWLGRQKGFPPKFVDWLADLRFTGEVDAMAEGTPFFVDEPILRVVAPLPQAQLVETRVVALLHFSSLIASKAARCVLAAPGKSLVDFGLRRAHGAEAGLLAARSAYLAGFAGSATVLAGRRYGIPTFGTMAHSFIQAHESETTAFVDFARAHPDNTTLLVDTYDTEAGAAKVVALAPKLRAEGIEIRAVRLDSGDLAAHARKVRGILDEGGCRDVRIFASGGLDEYALAKLAACPIDGFGVGTALVVSDDAPGLDCAYKLQEYAGVARRKRSEGKSTWPGRKQVFRVLKDGTLAHDRLALADEKLDGEALIQPVMRDGRRLAPAPRLAELRARTLAALDTLPESLRALEPAPAPYVPEVTDAVRALADAVDRRQAAVIERDRL